jgi:hypothetical protein
LRCFLSLSVPASHVGSQVCPDESMRVMIDNNVTGILV